MIGLEEFTMANKAVRYTAEFKRQMVDLVRAGRTPAALGKEFGPTPWSISLWVKQDDRDAGKTMEGFRVRSAKSSRVCGVRTASSRKNERYCQKPRPGLQRKALPRSALPIRESKSGHPSGRDNVPSVEDFEKWVLRLE
jgi:transposase-like protein